MSRALPRKIEVEVEMLVAAPVETTFAIFMPIDVVTIFPGYGPMPALRAVHDQTGGWSQVGETRTLELADGGTMHEELTVVEPPHHFAYRIRRLTNVLRHLVEGMDGAWWFAPEPGPDGEPATRARWRYEFLPRSLSTRPIAALILRLFWRPTMAQALALAARQAESRHREASA